MNIMSELYGVEFDRKRSEDLKTPADVIANEIAYANCKYKFAPGLLKEYDAIYGRFELADSYRWYAKLLTYAEGKTAAISLHVNESLLAARNLKAVSFLVETDEEASFYNGALLSMHAHLSLLGKDERQSLLHAFENNFLEGDLEHPIPEQQWSALQAKDGVVEMFLTQSPYLQETLAAFCDDLNANNPDNELTEAEDRFYLGYFIAAHDMADKLIDYFDYDPDMFY